MTIQDKNVPALRFPEYSQNWQEKKLGEMADVKTGPFGSTLHQHDYVEIGTPIITVEHLNELGITHNNLPLVSDEDKTRLKSYHLKTGDLVFSRVGSVDRCSMISEKENGWLFSGRLLRVRFVENIPAFFNYAFQLEETKQKVKSIAVGQTMPSINTEILKSITISFPKLPEQQKIASFLTAVDEKIQQLTKKKHLLEQYKKGVMQKIFDREVRFKDDNGNDFADWQEKKLGVVGEIVAGGTPDTLISEYWGGNIQWLTPTEIKTKYIHKSIRTITEKGLKKSSAKLLPIGTLLLSTRATVGDIGIAMYECCTNQGFQSIVVNDNNINEFIYYWIVKNKNEFLKRANGSTFLEINKTEISKLKIFLPSKPEQKKIADFLSAIDDKINLVNQKLENTRTYKKGLLQQMFI